MPNRNKSRSDRILVSLDFDESSSSFIKSLITLAAHLNAEICGLFIEDSELQQVASLPFSREIIFPTAHTRQLDGEQIARHLKKHAEALRKIMQELSQLSNVACTFKTTRGPRIESILNESYHFQIVAFLPEKYSAIKARKAARLEELINPTMLLYDSSKQADKSATIVKSLAEKGDLHHLTVLTLNADCETKAKTQFSFEKVKTDYQHIDSYSIPNITSLVESQRTGLLILPLEDALIKQSKEIKKMLDVLECPLLLVR